jgi:hypothetical protein
MAGTKGMQHRNHRANTLRARAWQSMRILRQFTVADLRRTSALETTESDYQNLKKWLRRLAVHGVIAPEGPPVFRRAGEYQTYRLARDIGPKHPLVCERCGGPISAPRCEQKEKETKKERERETETDIKKAVGGEP